ncbi:MAG: twin-arginine translocation signal domain-containing protein [Luteitalea sp.]|nr:twin-arginine translocation signal domain-containing protein [Luteitalea sp.]
MSDQHDQTDAGLSRRNFLRTATTAAVGATVASPFEAIPGLHAAGSDEIRVGVIGCGGRGSGAIRNILQAAEGVRIVAMGDAFEDRLTKSVESLTKRLGSQFDVPKDRQFVGLDAYEKVLAQDINYVILATPPGFRPMHIKAAVAAGKHVFAEKPVCVDVAGARTNLESFEEIRKKGLSLVAGTQYRHFVPYIEVMKRIKDGSIGDLVAGQCYYNAGELWSHERQPQWTDLEYQLRNWYYYTYFSGDHLVEQAVHNVDAMVWAFGAAPVGAVATGGRQVRTDPLFGHIYDHFTVDYEFADGSHCMMMCRQQEGADNKVANEFVGTKGRAFVLPKYYITGDRPWKLDQTVETRLDNAYVQEHAALISSIRAGKPLNELKQVNETSVAAILGREAAYTGKALTREELMASEQSLMPEKLEWGPMAIPPVAMPGETTL